jgi:hypothetical protein
MIHQENEQLEEKIVLKPLNIETIKELWSQTYNTHGKPDWSHIFPYYHKDIIFQDTIQRIDGIEKFTEMCTRLTARTKELNMEIVSIAQNEDVIIFEWIMTIMFKKWPSTYWNYHKNMDGKLS